MKLFADEVAAGASEAMVKPAKQNVILQNCYEEMPLGGVGWRGCGGFAA